MINVVTVHWRTPRWIDPQLAFLERNVSEPFRVFASLNDIDESYNGRFHYGRDLDGTHGVKLNALAGRVCEEAGPDEVLLFLDGDAFPVRPLVPWVHEVLSDYPLAAIRRDENLGDPQPHPSFCLTTVGFWREIEGDWRGAPWTNAAGREVVDAGGKLLRALEETDQKWLPLLRTNTYNPHPVWFGVYAHRVYHHGAGFQPARAERVDWLDRYNKRPVSGRAIRPTREDPSLGTLRARLVEDGLSLKRLRPTHLRTVLRASVKTLRLRREHRYFEKAEGSRRSEELKDLNEEVFLELSADPQFYLRLDEDA